MQGIGIHTLGLCEKFIVGEVGNQSFLAIGASWWEFEFLVLVLATAATQPHQVINQIPTDLQGQSVGQWFHVLWK